VSDGPTPTPSGGNLARFLELQNLGLNLAFAIAFLLVAAEGLPSLETFLLIVVAFVAARNAGHSFNRWADRTYDAQNPRTQGRALVTGARSPAFALAFAAANGAVLIIAAYFLNPLAFLLAPIALFTIFAYSYTKRYTTATTVVLGGVEAIIPGAIFIAVQGMLPPAAWAAVGAMLLWGTAFETIHSLGDVEADRTAGLHSIPVRLGVERSAQLVAVLHAGALVLFAAFGVLAQLAWPFYVALAGIAVLVGMVDARVLARPTEPATPFRAHFAMSALFLIGVIFSIF
jgi:4-hydroxybenzoate polyprenyltransferase